MKFNCGKKKKIQLWKKKENHYKICNTRQNILNSIFVYWITMLKILGYCAFDDFNLLLVKWRKLRANQILPYKERFS